MSGSIFKVFFTVLGMAMAYSSVAQQDKLGTWRMYLPYSVSKTMCDAGDELYNGSAQSIFSYGKTSNFVQTYDKSSGLSDIGIKTINYDFATKALVVAYINSNIDLIINGTDVYNIPDIKNKAITGAIVINGISFYDGDAYISTDMGISVIDLDKKEISNTYIIGNGGQTVKVYATTIDGTNIYAATETGVKYAPLSSANLLDFNSWSQFNAAQGLPAKRATFVTAYNNKVYAVVNGGVADTLYAYNGTGWASVFYDSLNTTITSLDATNSNLYFGIWDGGNKGRLGKIGANGTPVIRNTQGHFRPLNWFESNGNVWAADFYQGLFKYTDSTSENIVPDGPFTASVFRLNVSNGVVNVAPGGVDDSWGFTYNRSGFFIYENNGWTYRNTNNDNALTDITDIICSATVPSTGKTYFGSFYAGLIEYDNNTKQVKIYDKNNSILEGAVGDDARTKISALTVDRYDNLWISNAGAPAQLKVLKPDGTWKRFVVPVNTPMSLMKNIIVDQYNQVWGLTRQTNGGVVFSYGADMEDVSDDAAKSLRPGAGAGALPDENTFALAEDLDGNIWVGTNQGIGIYYCGGSVFSQGCDADQIKVVAADGYVGYLFGTESVRAIAVDAANRKWIGTTNGAWLISADGKEQLLSFNSSNSPMPANQVTDIAIDHNTGEVFIGTLGGLVSYQGDATGACADCGKGALVYPNPVKPGYDGPIAIKGLTSNAQVKITDVNGNIVFVGKANGTQMVWDGKNYNGERAQSGVYLVFSSGDLGEGKKVAKILMMN